MKWFELSEIISNPDNFDKKFMNSFLKSVKKFFLNKNIQIYETNNKSQDSIIKKETNDHKSDIAEKVNSQFYPI